MNGILIAFICVMFLIIVQKCFEQFKKMKEEDKILNDVHYCTKCNTKLNYSHSKPRVFGSPYCDDVRGEDYIFECPHCGTKHEYQTYC